MAAGSKSLRQILIRYLSEPPPAALVVDGIFALAAWAVLERVTAWLFPRPTGLDTGSASPLVFVANAVWTAGTALYYSGIVLCAWGCVRLLADSWGRSARP